MIRLGLLSFFDGRDRVHEQLKPDILAHEAALTRVLEATGQAEVVAGTGPVHSAEEARREGRRMADLHVDGVILNLPVFSFPNYAVIAVQEARGPFLLLGPQDPRYPGLGGLLAAGGALRQVGIPHERIWANLDDPALAGRLLVWARAAAAVTRLRGQVYGLLGGRSLGMVTGVAPEDVWPRRFGVDVEHIDQSEIVRRAGLVSAEDARAAGDWLRRHVAEVAYDGRALTPESLDREVRAWLALQSIVDDYGLGFVGLKCHYEMSEYYSVQCLGAAFLNDPYDWRGPKNPTPLACEADSDGALTMMLLSLVSGGPSCLLDVRYYDAERGVYAMPNCGAAPTWFAARSAEPAENLSRVRIVPAIAKYAGGGAHTEFVFGAGDLTLARLTRTGEEYRMLVTRGEARDLPIGDVAGANPGWPHAFVRAGWSPDALVQSMEANHLHAVAGDCSAELVQAARMLDIETCVLEGEGAA